MDPNGTNYKKTWLKTYSNSAFVDQYWEQTFNLRRVEFSKSKKNIVSLLQSDWPKFCSVNGAEFIRKDFYALYPEKYNMLIADFDEMSKKILSTAYDKSKKTLFQPKERTESMLYMLIF